MEMTSLLDRWLEPVITPDVAQRLVAMRPDQEVTKRVLELGAKANQGLLSPVGRATVELLKMNETRRVELRAALLEEGKS